VKVIIIFCIRANINGYKLIYKQKWLQGCYCTSREVFNRKKCVPYPRGGKGSGGKLF
jgi:hypothetical protein